MISTPTESKPAGTSDSQSNGEEDLSAADVALLPKLSNTFGIVGARGLALVHSYFHPDWEMRKLLRQQCEPTDHDIILEQ